MTSFSSRFKLFDDYFKSKVKNPAYRYLIYLCFGVLFFLALFGTIVFIQDKYTENNRNNSSKSSSSNSISTSKTESLIADESYWKTDAYKNRIKNQTLESFTKEVIDYLTGKNKDLLTRKATDYIFSLPSTDELDPTMALNLQDSELWPTRYQILVNYKVNIPYENLKTEPDRYLFNSAVDGLTCNIDDRTKINTGIFIYNINLKNSSTSSKNLIIDWNYTEGKITKNYADTPFRTNEPIPTLLYIFKKENKYWVADTSIIKRIFADSITTNKLDGKQMLSTNICNKINQL